MMCWVGLYSKIWTPFFRTIKGSLQVANQWLFLDLIDPCNGLGPKSDEVQPSGIVQDEGQPMGLRWCDKDKWGRLMAEGWCQKRVGISSINVVGLIVLKMCGGKEGVIWVRWVWVLPEQRMLRVNGGLGKKLPRILPPCLMSEARIHCSWEWLLAVWVACYLTRVLTWLWSGQFFS